MTTAQRAATPGVCALCAVETAAILAYYGTPILRVTLAGLIGLAITAGMAGALRAARRGDLTHHHQACQHPGRGDARVYRLPAADRGHNDSGPPAASGRVVRLDPPRR